LLQSAAMSTHNQPERRVAPRLDVVRRVNALLTPVGALVAVHDLSLSGFAGVSEMAFESGETAAFSLIGPSESPVRVSARAVHTQAFCPERGLYLTGFAFLPSPLFGLIPTDAIDQLMAEVQPREKLLVLT